MALEIQCKRNHTISPEIRMVEERMRPVGDFPLLMLMLSCLCIDTVSWLTAGPKPDPLLFNGSNGPVEVKKLSGGGGAG